jgi:hypothetical protein
MRGRRRQSVAKLRLAGVLLGTALFVFLPLLLVAGVLDCASEQPGLHCAIVKLAIDDGASAKKVLLRQATAQ